MEQVPFLRDIDDEKHYAQLLEVAYVEAFTELAEILSRDRVYTTLELEMDVPEHDFLQMFRDLGHLRVVMALTVRQSVGRRRRLADITRGLSDVILDEEGSEE